jgi:hypothetical protein
MISVLSHENIMEVEEKCVAKEAATGKGSRGQKRKSPAIVEANVKTTRRSEAKDAVDEIAAAGLSNLTVPEMKYGPGLGGRNARVVFATSNCKYEVIVVAYLRNAIRVRFECNRRKMPRNVTFSRVTEHPIRLIDPKVFLLVQRFDYQGRCLGFDLGEFARYTYFFFSVSPRGWVQYL